MRGYLLTAVGIGGLAAGATVYLTSGPDAPTPGQIATVDPAITEAVTEIEPDPSAIGPDAPIQELGQGEEGDWRRGNQTRFVLGTDDSVPATRVDASQIESGRYHYDGDLTISGNITMDYVEFTANSITVEGSVRADHVTLTGIEGEGENFGAQFRNIHSDDYYLFHWNQRYDRGDVTVTRDVVGDDISITAGRIDIGGDAEGAITLSASGGEIAGVYLHDEHWGAYTNYRDVDDGLIPEEQYYFDERRPVEMTRRVITVGGETGADVIRQSTVEFNRQQDAAAGIERPQNPLPPHLRRYGEPVISARP
ncbi:MAG: hypothetical protein AAF556_03700 [Pseudomonadota bacterium]